MLTDAGDPSGVGGSCSARKEEPVEVYPDLSQKLLKTAIERFPGVLDHVGSARDDHSLRVCLLGDHVTDRFVALMVAA
jgi:hypothetical protein